MRGYSETFGCSIEVPNAGRNNIGGTCGVKEVCEVCGLCAKHCIEHYLNRFGFRMIKTNEVPRSSFLEDFKSGVKGKIVVEEKQAVA